MKGLILSGGKGTRLHPITFNRAKQLVPVANKPVLFRVIEAIKEAGIDEIGIVIGDTGAEIREAVGQGRALGCQYHLHCAGCAAGTGSCRQNQPGFSGRRSLCHVSGRQCHRGRYQSLIRQFADSDWNSQIVLTEVEKPQHYGVAELDDSDALCAWSKNRATRPATWRLLASTCSTTHVFKAVNTIKPSWRGELEITDAIQWLVENGHQVFPYIHRGWWIDTGKSIDMLEANNRVLAELTHKVEGYVDRDSKIDHLVTVERGAEIINSVVRGPAIIGEGLSYRQQLYRSVYQHLPSHSGRRERNRT